MLVLVTAPHAVCLNVLLRDCDRVSEMAARFIAESLKSQELAVETFIGDLYRPKGDLNRRSTRATSYRRALTQSMQLKPCVVLDIHSFPSSESWREGTKSMIEVVILDNEPGQTTWVKTLVLYLKGKGVATESFVGATSNDVVTEARSYGIPAVLIEFHEGLSQDRIHQISSWVAAAVAQLSSCK